MRARLILAVILVLTVSQQGSAYKFIDFLNPNDQKVFLKWGSDDMPVPWYFNNTPPKDFSLEAAINTTETSYDTWESVSTSGITFRFGGTTNAEPFVFFDSINTLGFIIDPDLEGTGILGATNFIVFTFTGEIAESDIFFNDAVPWSVAPNGQPGHFDFQATATHEIGHFLGLDHSGVGVITRVGGRRRLVEGSAILYPFAFPPGTTTGRTLTADDIAGASALYPAGGFSGATGTMSGSVTKNGEPVEGAQVLTFNPFTDEMIAIFTDENGRYRVEGLKAGPHVVRVNPITDPTSPEDFGFRESAVDLDFRSEFYDGRAEVRSGAETSGINLQVEP
jgi:hypothetical protein